MSNLTIHSFIRRKDQGASQLDAENIRKQGKFGEEMHLPEKKFLASLLNLAKGTELSQKSLMSALCFGEEERAQCTERGKSVRRDWESSAQWKEENYEGENFPQV